MNKFTWTRDANSGGYTGRVPGQWIAYILNNGTWTLYREGEFRHTASGQALSVMSARSACAKEATCST